MTSLRYVGNVEYTEDDLAVKPLKKSDLRFFFFFFFGFLRPRSLKTKQKRFLNRDNGGYRKSSQSTVLSVV